MSNMGYCKFQNTSGDLRDCVDSMDDTDLSVEEKAARKRVIKICVDVALDYGYEIDSACVLE